MSNPSLKAKIEAIDFRAERSEDDKRITLRNRDYHFLLAVIGKVEASDIADFDLTLAEEIEELLRLYGE